MHVEFWKDLDAVKWAVTDRGGHAKDKRHVAFSRSMK